MNREPTLKKVLEPYLEGIETDLNYDPSGSGISALFLAMLYSTSQGFSPTEEDRLYAKKVVEILLEYGADPTRHEGDNPRYSTPLSGAKSISEAGKDPEGIYELLLKHSINSATESAAFENKLTDATKKVANGVGKAIKGLGGLGKKALEAKITSTGNIMSRLAEKVLKARDDRVLAEAKANSSEKRYISHKRGEYADPVKLENEYDSLPDSAKLRFIRENLPNGLTSKAEDTAIIKTQIAKKLENQDNPFRSDLYKSVIGIHKHLKGSKPPVTVFNILLNPKYEGLDKIFSDPSKFSKDGQEFTKQSQILAYWLSRGKNLDDLKDESGKWKSFKEMSLEANKLTTVDTGKGKIKSPFTKERDEIKEQVIDSLVGLGFGRSEANNYFNSISIPEGSTATEVIKLVLSKIGRKSE